MVISGEEVGWLGGLPVSLGTNRDEGKEGLGGREIRDGSHYRAPR